MSIILGNIEIYSIIILWLLKRLQQVLPRLPWLATLTF